MKAAYSSRRAVWSWALFDFANSPFTTLVITFVYATYFTDVIVSDSNRGTVLWSRAITISAVIIAVLSPVLGALADRGGYRKRFVILFSVICIAATCVLYFIEPGRALEALLFVIIANVAFEFSIVFYNAFLPDIAPPDRIGRVSGIAWGLGFFGGLLSLVVALVALVFPEQPWFGFSTDGGENIRATNLLVAAWFVVFSIPLLIWVREDKSRISPGGRVIADSIRQLRSTFEQVGRYRQVVRFLIARLIYNDALVTVFAFGGIYAVGTFGFTVQDALIFGIVVNLAAGVGATAAGYLDDHIGAKRTIVISLVGLIVGSALALLARQEAMLWLAGVLIGIFSGPSQASSRSLMARFVPPDLENEFFGFFAMSGKLTAFAGPALLGVLTGWSGSQRVGFSVVLVFFLLGIVLLLRVDEREGAAARPAAT
ncbi:MAG: MFS transporter [Gammaproteobacteria bacterium]